MSTIELTIEKARDGTIHGRVEYDHDLLVDSASTMSALERKFKKLLKDFHDVDPKEIKFDIAYDLTSLFDNKPFLNISAIAVEVGINASLMRQYASGTKFPSPETAAKIQTIIHQIGKSLMAMKISTPSTRRARTGLTKKKKARQLI